MDEGAAKTAESSKAALNRRNGRVVYALTGALLVIAFVLPRLWLDTAQFKDQVGVWLGYVCTAWLGFILLMPTAARFLRGRWIRLMAVRKEIGIGAGIFIVAHGFFSHAIGSGGDMDALNPSGTGCGFINFFLVTVLLITSIDRVRLSMSRTWWELHQRVGTFGMFWVGTMAAAGSEDYVLLPRLALSFTGLVFGVRLLQLYVDRDRIRRRRFVLNAWGFALFFGFVIASEITHRFYLLTAILAGVLALLGCVQLIRRRGSSASGEPPA